MTDLLLHPTTEKQVDDFVANPSHAITIVAPTGSGKHTLSIILASKLLNVNSEQLINQPYFRLINSVEDKAIGVDTIRQLEHFLSLKVPSHSKVRRVVLIEDAQHLTVEAQNAFLKTLEEPPDGTVFILSSSSEQALLPTIRSRSPRLLVTRPDFELLTEYFTEKYNDPPRVKQVLLVSGGLPGLADALLSQDQEHPLFQATIIAKQVLAGTMYQRLLLVDELSKNKPLLLNSLFILQQMAHLSMITAESKSSDRWLSILKASYQAEQALFSNAQPKLIVSDLMLHL